MWSSCLPSAIELPVADGPKLHPFPSNEVEQPEPAPRPVLVTKCPAWTAEDEFRRSGNAGKTFAYQWGVSSKLRGAIPAFTLAYYDEH